MNGNLGVETLGGLPGVGRVGAALKRAKVNGYNSSHLLSGYYVSGILSNHYHM